MSSETSSERRGWRELFVLLVQRNIKIRYKNSSIGFFWSLLSPLFLILIYSIFLGLMRFPVHFPTLVIGIFVWQFHTLCAGDALHAILGNANLIKKTAFPRILLPGAMVGANLFNFLLSMGVLLVYLALARVLYFGPQFPMLPLLILTQTALCLGLALLLSSVNVFFRDTEHLFGMVMMAWFFMTPVLYPVGEVVQRFAGRPVLLTLYFLNPMAGLVSGYRRCLMGTTDIPWDMLVPSFAVAWLVAIIGFLVFRRVQYRFAEEL
jgi:lipopolysaccharide transport system permease protein